MGVFLKPAFIVAFAVCCVLALTVTMTAGPVAWGGLSAFLIALSLPVAALFPGKGGQKRLNELGKRARRKKEEAEKAQLETLRAQAAEAQALRDEEERAEEERQKAKRAEIERIEAAQATREKIRQRDGGLVKAKRSSRRQGFIPGIASSSATGGGGAVPGSASSSEPAGPGNFFTIVLAGATAVALIGALVVSSLFWIPLTALVVTLSILLIGSMRETSQQQVKADPAQDGKKSFVKGASSGRTLVQSSGGTKSSISAGQSGGFLNIGSGATRSAKMGSGLRGGGSSSNPMGGTLLATLGFAVVGLWFIFYASGTAFLTGSEMIEEPGQPKKLSCVYVSATGIFTREISFAASNFRGMAKCRETLKVGR